MFYSTTRVTDDAAGLADDEITGRHVPDVNAKREVSVQMTSGDKTHVKSSAADVTQSTSTHTHTSFSNSTSSLSTHSTHH